MATVDLNVGDSMFRLGSAESLASFFSTVSYRLEPHGWGTRFPALMEELYLGYLPDDRADDAASELATVREELARLPVSDVIADYDDPGRPPPPGGQSAASAAEYHRSHDGRELVAVLEQALQLGSELEAPLEIEQSDLPDELGGPEQEGLDHATVARVLEREAREVLGRAGLERREDPLQWREDRGWWVGLVDLQQSTKAPGAFLNVAADWLWWERDWLAYLAGGRVGRLVTAEDEESFAMSARELAERGLELLAELRERFADPDGAARWLDERAEESEWGPFDAGVACGLAGRMDDARRWLENFVASARPGLADGDEPDRARRLIALCDDRDAFRSEVCAAIEAQRARLGMPARELHLCAQPDSGQ